MKLVFASMSFTNAHKTMRANPKEGKMKVFLRVLRVLGVSVLGTFYLIFESMTEATVFAPFMIWGVIYLITWILSCSGDTCTIARISALVTIGCYWLSAIIVAIDHEVDTARATKTPAFPLTRSLI
jgi:vacuolar-type H+-ATPase subunit I/STV1